MSVALRDSAITGTRRNTSQNPTHLDPFADADELSRALDTSRRQLQALVRQNDELLQTRSLLTESVTSLKLALAKANQFAHYDELTGLPNRRLLLVRFIQASALANRHRQSLALLFFDLNGFKSVNDKLGHEAGDHLLQQVATRLSNAIRKADTACRYGGDEFVVLLTDIASREHAIAALKKISACLKPTYVTDRQTIRLTASIGMAIYPQDAKRFADLVRAADHSMLKNKYGSRRRSGGAPKSNTMLDDAGHDFCLD